MTVTVHHRGRFLSLVERDGWEFATRTNPTVVVLVAWTGDARLLLVEQYREPVRGTVIELPAGLVGDLDGQEDESIADAAGRELVEETGYRAGRLREIMRCPTSAGMTDECAVFVAAENLERVGPGGGDDSEDIIVHAVDERQAGTWLARQHRAGKGIDPKIYTALYWRIAGEPDEVRKTPERSS